VPPHSVCCSISTHVGPTCRPCFAPPRACSCRLASYASPLASRPSSVSPTCHSRPCRPWPIAKKSEILGINIVAPSTLRTTSPRPHTSDSVPRGTTYFFQDCFPFHALCLLISCFTLDHLASVIIPPVWYSLPLWPCPSWPPHVYYCPLVSVRPSLWLSLFVPHIWVACWISCHTRDLDFCFHSLVESQAVLGDSIFEAHAALAVPRSRREHTSSDSTSGNPLIEHNVQWWQRDSEPGVHCCTAALSPVAGQGVLPVQAYRPPARERTRGECT
jgi:hypothetical protein